MPARLRLCLAPGSGVEVGQRFMHLKTANSVESKVAHDQSRTHML